MPKEIGGEIYWTLDEMEDRFNINPDTLIDLIKENKLTADSSKRMNDEWLISEAAIKEYRDTIEREKE